MYEQKNIKNILVSIYKFKLITLRILEIHFRVVTIKNDPWYWYLATTILLLVFEGIFTLTIKETQEWKW
jgi:hypothetical protein